MSLCFFKKRSQTAEASACHLNVSLLMHKRTCKSFGIQMVHISKELGQTHCILRKFLRLSGGGLVCLREHVLDLLHREIESHDLLNRFTLSIGGYFYHVT